MAWRIDADADALVITSPPLSTTWSACCWFWLTVDRNATSHILSIDANTDSNSQFVLQTSTDGTGIRLRAFNSSGVNLTGAVIHQCSLRTWYFAAFTRIAGTSFRGYLRHINWETLKASAITDISGNSFNTATRFRAGGSANTTVDPINGRIAGVKVWNGVSLSPGEFLRESFQLAPVNKVSHRLHLWWAENTGVDLSGRGRIVDPPSGTTFEPGPPVPLFRNQPKVLTYVESGGAANFNATGALSAQAAAITGSAVVGRTSTGALSAQAAAISGSATVSHTATGALAAQAASISGSAVVGRTSSGALAAQAAAIAGEATVSGSVDFPATGDLAAQASTLSGAAVVGHTSTGALAAQDSSIAGTVTVNRTSSGALASQDAAIAGDADVSGGVTNFEATGDLAAQSASISGTVTVNRVASGALEAQFATISGAADSSAVQAPEAAGPTPAGAATPQQQRRRQQLRRRYIMPDGTLLIATTQEAFEWLRQNSEPEPEPAPTATSSPREPQIRLPQIELTKRDVKFIPATDSAPDTWKAVVSERFTYHPPPEVTRQAQERINRMRADDEAILALMLWS